MIVRITTLFSLLILKCLIYTYIYNINKEKKHSPLLWPVLTIIFFWLYKLCYTIKWLILNCLFVWARGCICIYVYKHIEVRLLGGFTCKHVVSVWLWISSTYSAGHAMWFSPKSEPLTALKRLVNQVACAALHNFSQT